MKLIKKIKEWNPSIYATILLLLIPFVYFIFQNFELDNDFWFLINTGKVILERGFITVEPFTIHEGFSFLPQQWLSDIIFYLVYNKFNIQGIFILELLINSLIIFLIYKSSLLISKRRSVSIIISIVIDFIFLTSNILTTRPQMFDIVIFLLELFLIESYLSKNKKVYLYFIPLVSLLLINLHASMWLMFFVLLAPYYVEYIIKRIRKESVFKLKPLLIVTIISFLVGLINPYHINSILYLFNSYGISEINNLVGEMKPLTISYNCLIYIFIFIVLLLIYINKGNNKIRYILLFLGTTYLTLSHYKGFLFWLVCVCFIVSDFFKKTNKLQDVKLFIWEKVVYIILIIILVLTICFNIKINSKNYLKEIADYLDNNSEKDIKLFTGYNNGPYLEYRGYKCYIDTRAEVFLKANNKKEDIFKEYYKLSIGELSSKDFLNKYNFDYVLVDQYNNYILIYIENDNNYEKVLEVYNKDQKLTYYLYRRIDEKDN